MPPELGVLAGGGALPAEIAAAARRAGREVFVVAVEGITDASATAGAEHVWVAPGAFGRMIDALRKSGAREVVLAGSAARPDWSKLRLDGRAIRMLPRLVAADRGDNALLAVAIRELESEGFRVVGADAVAPELTLGAGAASRARPGRAARADITRGAAVLAALGPHDVGQAVVVHDGVVLGIEAAEGTDALIERCAPLRRADKGGVLVKCAKSHQDRRVDLPAIGPRTIAALAGARMSGAALEAGAALILQRPRTLAAADRARLFLYGIDPPRTA